MASKSKIEQLYEYLSTCPFLKVPTDSRRNKPQITVDYLGENPTTYDLTITPSPTWVRRYVDGGGVRQLLFLFRSLATYDGEAARTNMENNIFYEEFVNWLERSKPDYADWISVEALTAAYVQSVSETQDKASYEIRCRLLYASANIYL